MANSDHILVLISHKNAKAQKKRGRIFDFPDSSNAPYILLLQKLDLILSQRRQSAKKRKNLSFFRYPTSSEAGFIKIPAFYKPIRFS